MITLLQAANAGQNASQVQRISSFAFRALQRCKHRPPCRFIPSHGYKEEEERGVDGQVRMRDVLCSSVDVLGIVILYDDGEVWPAAVCAAVASTEQVASLPERVGPLNSVYSAEASGPPQRLGRLPPWSASAAGAVAPAAMCPRPGAMDAPDLWRGWGG